MSALSKHMLNTIKMTASKIFKMIKTVKEYDVIVEKIEELLKNPDNIENTDSKGFIELNLLSDLVADYEEKHFPVAKPTLIASMKLRMNELGINQKKLSDILGISTSRISEYLTGKSEPTLKIAREISVKLNIDASIVLGV